MVRGAGSGRRGAGLVIVEGIPAPRFRAELKRDHLTALAGEIHEGGALAAVQLIPVDMARHRAPPATLSGDEIEAMVADCELAARRCREAGFDGVELHGAHGFVLNQFFSPQQNERRDAYGGSFENRSRLALRIVGAMREAAGDALLLYRHTPVGPGYGVPESHRFARMLVEAGVDVLDLSPSSAEEPGDLAAPFGDLGVRSIAVGAFHHVERPLTVLREGRAQLVAVGRGLIADPQWPHKVREGRLDEIVMCAECNKGCHGNLAQGIPIACVMWENEP